MIVVQFDHRYHHWALLALRSLALHEPAIRVVADTLGLTPSEVERLERAHPLVHVDNAAEKRGVLRREQMANRKPFVLRDIVHAFPDEPWHGIFDADLLVRRPLPDLWGLLADHQAAVITRTGEFRGRVHEHLINPSGIVLVRRDGRALIDGWAKWAEHRGRLGSIDPGRWYWDQQTLYEAKRRTGLSYAAIPMGVFADVRTSVDAAVWSAHTRHKTLYYLIFRQELDRQESAHDGAVPRTDDGSLA